MAWIESHQALVRHPKTRRLARALGVSIPTAIGTLHCLWYWVMDYAQDGDLSAYSSDDLADAMLWEGEPDTLIAALVQARFLDDRGGELHVHDWQDYAGRLAEKRSANAERMRLARAGRATPSQDERAAHVRSGSDERAAHVQRTPSARAGLPDLPTGPDLPDTTGPDLTKHTDRPTAGVPRTHARAAPAQNQDGQIAERLRRRMADAGFIDTKGLADAFVAEYGERLQVESTLIAALAYHAKHHAAMQVDEKYLTRWFQREVTPREKADPDRRNVRGHDARGARSGAAATPPVGTRSYNKLVQGG